MRRMALTTAAVLVSGGLGACESTQTKSARLEKTGRNQARQTTVKAGAANTAVKVLSTAVLHSATGNAAVVQLRNTGAASEVRVPLLVAVKDPAGKVVYKNDIAGLQPSLQELAYLAKGQTAYWVNDQVLAVDPPKGMDVAVGKEQGSFTGAAPRITLARPQLDRDSTGPYATGEVRNGSALTQVNLPIFAVALKGGKVVAAGRAIIPRLAPAPTRKPVMFKIYFVGDPKGAALRLTAAPTVHTESAR
jgi:hypothetical protein